MRDAVRKYLAAIGRRGGKKSRRRLDPADAKKMTKIRDARRAFRQFYSLCFWSFDPKLTIGANEIAWVARQLMQNGNRQAWRAAERLCR
jgi:hypothetical protein